MLCEALEMYLSFLPTAFWMESAQASLIQTYEFRFEVYKGENYLEGASG